MARGRRKVGRKAKLKMVHGASHSLKHKGGKKGRGRKRSSKRGRRK